MCLIFTFAVAVVGDHRIVARDRIVVVVRLAFHRLAPFLDERLFCVLINEGHLGEHSTLFESTAVLVDSGDEGFVAVADGAKEPVVVRED